MIVGFTGTRSGMSPEQSSALLALLQKLDPDHFHHGACVGADIEAAKLCKSLLVECVVHAHPGVSAKGGTNGLRAQGWLGDVVYTEQTHFARNRAIVDACDALIAAPYDLGEQATGGTWYTIGYARKTGKTCHIIWRDGREEQAATL